MNNLFNFSIGVEKDDNSHSKNRWMVVIRKSSGLVHGIPIRNVSKKAAVAMLRPLSYAFTYGADSVILPFIHITVKDIE